MAELQSLPSLLVVFLLSIFLNTMVLVKLLFSMVKQGPSKFFKTLPRTSRPAVMNDPQLGEHKFAPLKDIKLHYVENGPSDGTSKPLMLLCHGFPECWFSWRYQLKHFNDRYRTVAMDMRGYCESDKPYFVSDYTMDKLTGDIRDIIQYLGYESCVLVGHDWGGAVCSAFAQIHPTMVDRLILLNIPHTRAFQKHAATSYTQMLKSWYIAAFQLPYIPELLIRSGDFSTLADTFTKTAMGASRTPCTPEEVEAYKYAMSQPGGLSGPINYYRAALRYKPLIMDAPKITVPTLRIWGEQDDYLEKEMAELSANYHTDHVITYIPTGSHWVMLDEPEQVNSAMDNFLSGDILESF